MTDKYRLQGIFRDDKTRLVIPNLSITATTAITNIVSSFVTNPTQGSDGWFSYFSDIFVRPADALLDDGIKGFMTYLINLLVIGLGVTKIETTQEYTMPFSKGIGSTGEVIHLLGAKNEMINLEFTTDQYPGRLGYVLRAVLQKVLETAQVIYLVDDLFLATPCLVKKSKLYKEGTFRGAVMGELELVALTTGGSFMEDTLGGTSKIKVLASKLRNSVGKNKSKVVVGVGVMAVSGVLLGDIIHTGLR